MLTNLCRARPVWGGIMRRQRVQAPGGSRAGASPRQRPLPLSIEQCPGRSTVQQCMQRPAYPDVDGPVLTVDILLGILRQQVPPAPSQRVSVRGGLGAAAGRYTVGTRGSSSMPGPLTHHCLPDSSLIGHTSTTSGRPQGFTDRKPAGGRREGDDALSALARGCCPLQHSGFPAPVQEGGSSARPPSQPGGGQERGGGARSCTSGLPPPPSLPRNWQFSLPFSSLML